MQLRSKLIFAVALSAHLAAAFAGTALAAADPTLGIAIMSASVNPDGTHASGNGAGVVESAYDSSGKRYIVKFNRPLAGCVNTASAGSTGVIVSTRVYPYAGTLAVNLVNYAGTPVTGDFQVIVFCAR